MGYCEDIVTELKDAPRIVQELLKMFADIPEIYNETYVSSRGDKTFLQRTTHAETVAGRDTILNKVLAEPQQKISNEKDEGKRNELQEQLWAV